LQSYFNLKNLFIYKEPTNEEMGFELTEDSNEGNENGKQAPHSKNIRQEDKEKQKRTLKMRLAERKENKASKENQQKKESDDISQELSINLETVKLKFLLPKNKDIIIREFNIGRKVKAFMVYIEDMVDKRQLNSSLLPQLMAKDVFDGKPPLHLIEYLIDNIIISHHVMRSEKFHDVVRNVLGGGGALFVDNCEEAILIEMLGIEKRSINVPQNEPVIKGSQEAFTENLGTNVSLVRQIIKNENLVADFLPVGNTNHSNCAMMYLEGVANPKVIQEVMKRIRRINSDFILGSSFIQQFIDDNPYMVLPQTLSTERPDRAANAIMQGYVAVIADGTPSAISVPCTFFRLMHSAEDINLRWIFATFLRLLRYLGLIAALFLPSLYLALILFHNEMIPTELLVSIARS
jgi:spore germination protein KA